MPATAKFVLVFAAALRSAHLALLSFHCRRGCKIAIGGRFLLQRMFGSPH